MFETIIATMLLCANKPEYETKLADGETTHPQLDEETFYASGIPIVINVFRTSKSAHALCSSHIATGDA